MLLKGALHVHTTCSDGELTPQEAANAYEERGFDFIAFQLTDLFQYCAAVVMKTVST